MTVTPLLLAKNLLFTVLPGSVTVLFPYWILDSPPVWSPPEGVGSLFICLGFAIYFRCLWSFAARGGGTPAPIDAPKKLVVDGLYRYVRNPMYLGVFAVLLGETLLFRSLALGLYSLGCFVVWHLFVLLYEEPVLSRNFGTDYDRYRDQVSRWCPRLRPARLDETGR